MADLQRRVENWQADRFISLGSGLFGSMSYDGRWKW